MKSLGAVKVKRVGEKIEDGDLIYWAQQGRIIIHDTRDDSYKALTTDQWQERIDVISRCVSKSVEMLNMPRGYVNRGSKQTIIAEREADTRRADAMIEVLKQAIQQGDPTDPRFISWLQRHRTPSRIIVPAGITIPSAAPPPVAE